MPQQLSLVRQVWPDPETPILLADFATRFVVSEDEIANGVPGDPMRCTLALVSERVFGAPAVFFKSVAYVEMGNEVFKFSMPATTRRLVDAVDRKAKDEIEPGVYELLPMPEPKPRPQAATPKPQAGKTDKVGEMMDTLAEATGTTATGSTTKAAAKKEKEKAASKSVKSLKGKGPKANDEESRGFGLVRGSAAYLEAIEAS